MALTFYYGSGSPFAWKVWLVLHHKGLPHEARRILFDRSEIKGEAYLAKNPRGKVPTLEHDGYVLWESWAIVDYLERAFPEPRVWPSDLRAFGRAKRIGFECDNHLYPPLRRLLTQTLHRPQGDGDPNEIREARALLNEELQTFAGWLQADFFAGELSCADYAVYPMLRLIDRLNRKQPKHGVELPEALHRLMQRIDALPFARLTEPPHWVES